MAEADFTQPHQAIPKSTDPEKLRNVINTIDAISQAGFGQIEAISNLILKAMEVPNQNPLQLLGDIGKALCCIKYRAEDSLNTINYEAESMGCNYRDMADRRRTAAITNAERKAE